MTGDLTRDDDADPPEADEPLRLTRRSALLGAAGVAAAALVAAAPVAEARGWRQPLWRAAQARGIVFGTAFSTRLLEDRGYSALVDREATLLFTEDDLLWYKLRPRPGAALDFAFADRFYAVASRQRQLVFGAHLVWDEGFGEGCPEGYLSALGPAEARTLLYGTVEAVVRRYRGRTAGWIVVNEAIDANEDDGLRRDYPWYQTIGESYVAEAFRIAHAADPRATLVLNEFGHETDDEEGDRAADKRAKTLLVLDRLLAADVPVHALGVQAHLLAADFAERFDRRAYRRFLSEVADRGVQILITELDVLDDGLPADARIRDRAVGEACRRYLDTALDEPAVRSVMTFGLSDRHTWLQEDYPREDGAPRRPLPFDDDLRPKRAFHALHHALGHNARRRILWPSPRLRRARPAAGPLAGRSCRR